MASALNSSLILVIAVAASAAMIVALKPYLARYAVARPNARSSHAQPTPQGGGIPVVAATILAVLAGAAISGAAASTTAALWPLAAAVVLLAITGACDDIFHVSVAPRFLAQFVAVAIVLAMLPADARILPLLPWWIERVALLVAGVYAVNVVNFMDGLDLMTVAEVVPLTAGLWILSLVGALTSLEGAVAVALLGAIVGFAPFNRPVAKLFLGDVGSLPIGLLLFWLLLRLAANGHLAAAIELPLYYVADATITLALRIVRRENVLRAHRTHFYQRATDRGYSVAEVVTSVFFVNVALAFFAILSIDRQSVGAQMFALGLGAVTVLAVLARFARGKR